MGGGETCIFFLCAHTGKGVWGRAEGSRGEAAASGSRRRAGGGMRVGPLPRAPRACHFGCFHDTGRGVGERGGAGLRQGACPSGRRGAAARAASAAAEAGGAGGGRGGGWGRRSVRREARAPRAAPAAPSARVAFVPGAHRRASERASARSTSTGDRGSGKRGRATFSPLGLRRMDWLNVQARLSGVCCVCARRKGLPDSHRAHAHSHARTHSRTRGGARRPRVCIFFLAASPFPTDCVRISYRSAPISAILGKLHKNKPSGLFLPEAGKCFGKRGGAGPPRPSARGRTRAAGRAGSPRRRGVRPAPCRAGPGAGAGVCREAAVAAVGGSRRAGAAGGVCGGRRGAAFLATCLRCPYIGEAERGPRRGRRPLRAACVCHSGIMGFAHSRPGPGGPSSRRGGRAGGSRGRRGWGSGSAGDGASAARPASWCCWGWGGKLVSPGGGGRGTVARAGGGRNFCPGGKTLITFQEKRPYNPPTPTLSGQSTAHSATVRESLKAGGLLPAFPVEGWGYLFVRLRSEKGGGNEPPCEVAKTVALTPPFHGETKVNVALVSLPPLASFSSSSPPIF